MADKITRFLLGLAACALARPTVAATEDTPIVRETTAPGAPAQRLIDWAARNHAELSFSVATLPDSRPIARHSAEVLRNPASVSKVLTSFVALRILGPSYRFKTTLHGDLDAGRLRRLVIRGQGDPSLSSEVLEGVAARLAAMGISSVDEALVVDQSYFDDRFVPPAFDQQPEEWAAFRAPVCATAVDGNRFAAHVIPGPAGKAARVFVEPFGAAGISGVVRSVAGDTKGARVQLRVAPSDQPQLLVGGEIGERESPMVLTRRTEDPRRMVGHVLRRALLAHGVAVTSEIQLGVAEGLPVLVAHESEALATLLPRLGKESDNFAAEMLLKSIGAKVSGIGSSEAGAKVVAEVVAGAGAEALRFVNGSGLFDANRVTTDLLVRVLGAAYSDRSLAPEFFAQLAIAGKDGTLTKRLRNLPTGCFVRGKTGTLRNTIGLAGYVERPDGATLAFAVLAEKVKDQAATRAQIDQFVESWCRAPISSRPQL